jgi:type II secretory pathway component PulM
MENKWNTMDPRLRDIIIAVVAFAVLVILLVLLPLYLSAGIAYLIAILVFIIMMSGAGIMINLKANPGKAK